MCPPRSTSPSRSSSDLPASQASHTLGHTEHKDCSEGSKAVGRSSQDVDSIFISLAASSLNAQATVPRSTTDTAQA